jgi:hypothetical protein
VSQGRFGNLGQSLERVSRSWAEKELWLGLEKPVPESLVELDLEAGLLKLELGSFLPEAGQRIRLGNPLQC